MHLTYAGIIAWDCEDGEIYLNDDCTLPMQGLLLDVPVLSAPAVQYCTLPMQGLLLALQRCYFVKIVNIAPYLYRDYCFMSVSMYFSSSISLHLTYTGIIALDPKREMHLLRSCELHLTYPGITPTTRQEANQNAKKRNSMRVSLFLYAGSLKLRPTL